MSADIEVKQKEAKTLKFTLTDGDGDAYDATGGEFSFVVAEKGDSGATLISKTDTDFDKTEIADGIVYLALDMDDLDQDAGNYVAELKSTITASNIDKSHDFSLKVTRALTT